MRNESETKGYSLTAIGMIELSSIAAGYESEDAMLKAAEVTLITARTVCSGKYIVIVGGMVGPVESSVRAGVQTGGAEIIESLVIPNVHPDIFPAITCTSLLELEDMKALGIIETFSAASIIESADAAAKAAMVKLFRVHVCMAIGGKGYLLLTGDVAAVQSSINAGAELAGARGVLVNKVVIPGPRPELFRDFI